MILFQESVLLGSNKGISNFRFREASVDGGTYKICECVSQRFSCGQASFAARRDTIG